MKAIKTMLKALRVLLGRKADKKWVENEFSQRIPSPDWEVNNPEDKNYIKNRIAYTEYEEVGKFHFINGVLAENEETEYFNLIAKPFDTAGKNNDKDFSMTVELGGKKIAIYCSYYYNNNAHEIRMCDTPDSIYVYKICFDCNFGSTNRFTLTTDGTTFSTTGNDEVTFYNEKVKILDEKYSPNGNIVNGNSAKSVRTLDSLDSLNEYEMGVGAFAEGYRTQASGKHSHAEGGETTASALYSHAEGYNNAASAKYSHAEGGLNKASGDSSHAEGSGNTASGKYAHAEGSGNVASGDCSHAEGCENEASGFAAHVEGSGSTSILQSIGVNKASGDRSHAEGFVTEASGANSHTEGSYTKASGKSSHAEGNYSEAIGGVSHAEGNSKAKGEFSHAEGLRTVAIDRQHVQGQYNIEDTAKVGEELGILEDSTYTTTTGKAAYNFAKDSDGYYVSQNKGVASSVAYGKITFNFTASKTIGITAISYGDSNYDYGIVSTLDTDLAISNTLDSANVFHSFKGESSAYPQMLKLAIPAGEHYLTFKYIKDNSGNSYNDSFKIKFNAFVRESTYADIVGNGQGGSSANAKSNAYALDWDGNAFYAGDVYANVEKGLGSNAKEGNKLVTNTELDEAVNPKLDAPTTATAGQVIAVKTVDEDGKITEVEAVDMSGGSGGTPNAVQYVEQTLTDEQKAQARTNIGAGTSSFSGSYNDLADKPTIPEGYTLPMASADVLGGVKPAAKTDAMTSAVGVDADGKLWSAAGGGTLPKYELIWEHTITAEETAVNLISITSTEFPKLTKCRGLVCEITAESNTKITPWVKLNINNIPVAQFTGLTKELPRWGVAVNRLFGRWLGQSVYNPQSENDNAAIVIPSYAGVFNTTFDADISSLSVGSYIAWATEGQIIRLWGCK